jgi:hypothetical protein
LDQHLIHTIVPNLKSCRGALAAGELVRQGVRFITAKSMVVLNLANPLPKLPLPVEIPIPTGQLLKVAAESSL